MVITPFGQKEMDAVEVGDTICDTLGGTSEVIGKYRHVNHPFYRVSFSDGTSVVCGPEHLWLAWRSHIPKKSHRHPKADYLGRVHGINAARVMRTDRIIEGMEKGGRYRIPLTAPASGNYNRHTIDPYALGALLGDAQMQTASLAGVTLHGHQDDIQVMQEVAKGVGEEWLQISHVKGKPHLLTGRLATKSPTYNRLYQGGFLGKRSWEKTLPEKVFYAPVEWRRALLQGLMDTDGWCEPKRGAYFSTTAPGLRDGVAELARSLGCFVSITDKHPTYTYNGEKRDGRPAFTLRIKSPDTASLFRLSRKRIIAYGIKHQSLAKEITDIEYLGKNDGACISVDCPTGLYLTNNYTVTHNTQALLMGAARHISVPNYAGLMLRRNTTQIRNPGGLWSASQKMYPHLGGIPRQTPTMEWNWPHVPSVIQFNHLQHEATVYSYLGAEIGFIGFDELVTFEESQFWYMVSRNRSTARHKSRIRAGTNPLADSFVARLIEWWIDQDSGYAIPERSGVLRWFVRVGDALEWADTREEVSGYTEPDGTPIEPKSLTFIPAKLEDNPELMRADPGYRASLQAMQKVERERLLHGNWKIRPAAGMYFRREWCEVVDEVPADVDVIRGWDLAATEERPGTDPDWTASVKLGKSWSTGRFYILHASWLRAAPHGVQQHLRQTAEGDGGIVRQRLPIDPGQSGKWQTPDLARVLNGFQIEFEHVAQGNVPGTPRKVGRFSPFSAQCEAGNVAILRGTWNERLSREWENFPSEKSHDDSIDSGATAYHGFTTPRAIAVSGSY